MSTQRIETEEQLAEIEEAEEGYERLAAQLKRSWLHTATLHEEAKRERRALRRQGADLAERLGMSRDDLGACQVRERRGKRPRTVAAKRQQVRYVRDPSARKWEAAMARADWAEREARARLASTTRRLVEALGEQEAARLLGVSTRKLRALCHER